MPWIYSRVSVPQSHLTRADDIPPVLHRGRRGVMKWGRQQVHALWQAAQNIRFDLRRSFLVAGAIKDSPRKGPKNHFRRPAVVFRRRKAIRTWRSVSQDQT